MSWLSKLFGGGLNKVSRGGVVGTPVDTSAYQVNVTTGYGDRNAGIERGTGADWFGPLNPLAPIAPPDVASRQFDFEPGFNLQTKPRVYEPIGFKELRGLADGYDLLRLVIETRKDQIARMEWSIGPIDPKAKTAKSQSGIIEQVTKFFKRPDGVHNFGDWARLLTEDLFVIDAPTLFKQRDKSGNLIALLPIDGALIKPVIDDWGRIPQPFTQDDAIIYPVAYQQVMRGFPAVDYSVRDLIYRPRNIRVNRVYGYSPVEQVIATVNIAVRRQLFLTNYYTEGNIPDSLIGVPETWTPDQIKTFQKYWDQQFEGNLKQRRHAKFVPGGVAKTFIQTKEPDLKSEFDEWLARVVCFAFSISPQAFVKQMNRASADTQKEVAEEEGLTPILDWLKALIDDIIHDELGLPDLAFSWGEDEQTDEQVQETILTGYASKGIYTINEVRGLLGKDPLPNEACNQPMIVTATGYVPVEANTIEGKQANLDAFGAPPAAPGQPGTNEDEGEGARGGDTDKKPKEVGKSASATFRKGGAGNGPDHLSQASHEPGICQCAGCVQKGLRYAGQSGRRTNKGYLLEAVES